MALSVGDMTSSSQGQGYQCAQSHPFARTYRQQGLLIIYIYLIELGTLKFHIFLEFPFCTGAILVEYCNFQNLNLYINTQIAKIHHHHFKLHINCIHMISQTKGCLYYLQKPIVRNICILLSYVGVSNNIWTIQFKFFTLA